ncbi:non-ribosomal peptide synthetase [Pseudoalteromonas rubra]|uniref:non-ribosomal peptide synthetase n=1 Tax=Pseudoalteromonas rubra TaxID=43658 RepID=UPI000F789C54|nr:non-ribosomal peptide synthetase [Pseudoalteromonas rubra]
MNTQAIIDQLTNNQILLSVNGDRLAVEAKKGALTAELASLIRDNKPALMEYLSQQQAPLAIANPIQPVVREAGKSYPLSSAQKRFWFIDQLRGGSSDYHMPLAFTLTDAVSMTHLESALNHVLKKHEILRSRYVLAADGATEQQLSDESISIRYHDSTSCDEQTFKADIQACIAAPFALGSDLMIRVDHFRTPDALHADALLIINIHHIACDAWSLDILKQDLMTAYMQLQGGMQPQAELPLQYLDYASWQQDWLNGEQCTQQTDYWRNKLAGMAQLHSLPLDHARQADKANFGKLYSEALPAELVPVLHRIAREYKLTPFMLLHSALALTLSQYGQYQDVVMGTTISNRDSEQLHPMIGCFLNRLVLRLDTDRAQSLSDYLKQVARTHIEAQNNQLLPFDNLVEALDITRAANYSPLFQIQFTLGSELGELSSQDAALLSNAGFAGFELSKETVVVRGDLDIHARVSEQNMVIDWSYDNELFDTQTIATLSSLFQQICRNLTQAYQQQTITTASVADVMFNQPQTLYTQAGECRLDDATGLIERFEQQAALTPDAIAVHSDTEQLSYAQLNTQAAKLADCLQEQGVEPGDLVGVCMPRSACLMVSLLGVLKAGAAYIPFEPSNTKARNQQIIADAALEWVIVSDALAARVPDAGVDLLLLEQDVTDANWLSGYDAEFGTETVAHDSPAYVIYTSGSTGTPKGVEISHRALMDYLNFALKGYYADHLNGSLLVTSHGFDIGVPSLYLPLLSGGSVQLLDNQELLPVLSKALNKADEPRLVRMTPHHVEGVLALQEAPLAGVQHVFVIGGERFERDVALALQTQFPDSQVFNHYGPSEATVGCVMYDISANQADLPAELPIGRAMDNTYAYVLDAQLNALPQGARGELFVGGPCLATGYVNNPTLSAERFIENPFYDPSDATSPARLYRTGDQVRYQNSGELMFLGRIDEQVKIRGFRVELGDISSQLQQITGVESAEVLCKALATGPELVAYIKAENSAQLGALLSDCERLLGEQLPAYMVPAHFVGLQNWPLTANGKLDKKALPDPQEKAAAQHVAPRTATEQQLVELWSSLLKLTPDQISVDSSFFKLGGHSLLSVRLVAAIKQAFGVEFSISELFEHASIASQAQQVEHKQAQGGSTAQRIEVQARPQDGRMAASFAQQRLWFIDRLQGGSAQYNMPAAFEVSGELDLDAVEAALNTIVARHEVLRSSYSEVQGEIYQQAQAPYDCQVERFDLSTLEASAQAEALEQNLITFSQHAFVLQEAQMLSARYLILSDQSGVLALNMPHIVSDGWSMQLLVKEFTALYTAHLSGQHAQLAPLPIQYADYAHWQRNWLAGDAGVSQLDYWKKQLDGVPTVHGLPLQGRRGEMKNHTGESLEMTLSQSVSRRLTELASTLEITPFMLLHGALAIVLSRHSNSHDIVIGTPVANRQHADLTSLIGFFVNSLVLRLNTSDKTLTAFFEHVKQTHIAAQENQDIPFEQLVEHLDIETNTSQSPLFQIMLLTDNDYGLDAPKAQSTRLGDAQLKPIEDPQVTVKFDLDIFMSVNEHGGKLKINFDNHLFSAQYIDSLMSHLANTLTNLAQADITQQSVARLPMLSEQQSQELVFGRNQTQRSYDDEACINSIFERHVAAQPDAPALQFGESVLSYQALNERAEQLASYLVAQHQIVPDTIVGLCMERSADMIIAMLAILKAGGAYLPLDPDYPMERLEYMVDDAKVAQILSYGRGVEVTDALCQDRDIANLNVSNLSEAAASDEQPLGILKSNHSLAYVIYTSGSTGRPKGVGLSHKGAVNLAANQQVLFDITPASRVLQFASISFDAATWDWVMALLNGATLVICDEQARTEGGKLGEVLKQQAITHATLPPALLSTMALQTDLALQCLIVAGEACEEQVVERWRRHYRFFNAYGPSETSVCATVGEITDNSIHIGRPLYNVQTLILDEHQSLVPFGCAGELYVGGDGLARGYLNQPQLTAERFIDNPFYDASVPGSSERLYRTGDLVRYQADGNLAFIGRTDDQIKIRGFRVELGEIAQQLSQQTGVESALVVAKTGAIGTYLVAYLQPAQAVSELSDNEFTQGALAELASQVPDYMVPKLGVVVAEWPLTANGKINKKALPEADTMALQGEYVAPACETERAICQIWAELLDMAPETISTTANFFHLGGHSLLSVRLAAGLREQLGVELPVKTLFNAATVAEQAEEIIARRGQAVREGVKALPRITIQDEQLGQYSALPQSFAQQRLWFIDQLHSDSAQYNMPAAFEVEGELELAVVEAALQTIIARHEVLRTVYRDGEHGAEQLILDEAQFSLGYEDIRMYNPAQQQQAIAGAMAQLLSQPFDLTKDVMVRAGYLHTSQSSGVLLFNMHHIASDGWSMQVLVKEFVALYQAYSQGQGNPLAPLTIQYADYAQWQRAYLSEAVLEQQLGYWQQQLADVPPVHSLPLDHPRPEVKQHQGAQVTGSLSKEVAQGLAALAKAEGLTPFMLLHGALSLLLSRHSNAQNIVIGTPVANRTQAELEPLIGFFVNTLVLNVNTDQATLAEYLAHVKSVHLDAQSNQDVPFEQLVEQLNVPRSTAHTPLFQVMLRTQTDYGLNTGMDESVLSLGDAQLSPLAEDSVVAKFDLDVHMALSESGVDICWTYDTALFSAARIETLNRHLGELLSVLTASEPQEILTRVPGTLNMLSQAERQELLVSLNQTEQDYDTQLCIHTLFEQQAQQQPQAMALTGPQRTLSYEALNTLSNQFAHHLIDEYGIAPGQRVGICVERSEYILVTMLAVLKAGAAYVPFDHHNTLHRNQQIIDDAQLDVVFTDPERIATLPQSCARLEVAALEAQLSGQGKRDNPQQTVSAGDLAYVIYTSGTTGKPKGVQLRHSNVCDYLQSVQHRYYAQPQSSLLVTSYAFDISVPSLFLPLISGTSVNILAGEARFESMKHELQEQPYLLRMTPHHGKALVAFMGEEVCQLTHTFVIGGEAFPLELYDQLQAKFPNSVIYNHYGPTEATVGAIALNVTAQRDQIGATMPIGRPLPNTKVYILNKELGLVPKGAMGELYIAGPSVSKGYLNRDELTQKSFVVNPFEDENSQYNLMYKTGDLARYIGEDYLEYCGRVDEQIKIRGFRIEVGDIESQLLQLPEVDSAVVQAKELAGQLQLVAYVKFDLMHEIKFASSESQLQDNERKLAAIKRSLAGQLPEYMLPSQYLVMTDWPLSANGKLDKKALPEPSLTELSSVAVQPVSETEVRLVQIWSEVLQTSEEHISVVESFFSLGGNSLSLMLLLNKLRSEFGAALQLRELYQSSDIQSMAKRIEHLLWMEQDDDDEYEGELLVL